MTPKLPCWPLLAALTLATPALAQQAASQPTPHRRAADPALVRSLQGHVWTLQSATEASGQPLAALALPGLAFKLRFDGARVALSGGCNQLMGSWRLSPQGQLGIGRLAGTMKACEPALMQADGELSALLAQPLQLQLQAGPEPTLRLAAPAGQTLAWIGQPTPQSQYGQATRIFLEVAPQTAPCQPGAGAPTQCLQVRERRFDAQGLRIEPPGPWQAFYSPIEGYTHTPGVRNVLRIDRYTRRQAPADASAYVYVLDMVVESETVKP